MITFERGKDLEFLFDSLSPDDILVTYNGKRFDVPFLEREFRYRVKNPQLDLMNLLHSIGIKGGLKKSEIQLGLVRPDEIAGMDGRQAPLLWFEYQRTNNLEALEKLIAYNREDTKNLEIVLEKQSIGLQRTVCFSAVRTYTLGVYSSQLGFLLILFSPHLQ